MCDGPQLMVSEGDRRVHASKGDVGPIVFTGPGGVHFLVVLMNQSPATFRVPPNPVLESIPDGLLLLGRQSGLPGVEDSAFFSVRILHGVINTDIPQVQTILQNLVGVGTAGAVCGIGRHIVFGYRAFARDLPLGGIGSVVDLNGTLKVVRCVESFIHELLNVLLVNPGGPQADFNLRGVQVFGLGSGQGLYVDDKGRVLLCSPLCLP